MQECSAFTVGPSQKKGTGYARRKGQSLPQITPDYMSGGSENAKVNAENASPRHIIFKWQKIKGKENLERSQRKKIPHLKRDKDENYPGLLIRNKQTRREWSEISKVMGLKKKTVKTVLQE